mmetsp:Transcript_23657/g.56024  ORF Transcript_23657/g.56024 Transcript_23657/m.56024 type:complete len:321 (-) Transcript_23657:126-1088(-)|eukprot:CAMPEP_0197192524 /NCGR_PEP_ID=MMETSP1423-20130617/25197_1 /TAXON_ID=476441 /ORGANISM="Pseudo-nitzschia heimii, Strain UNC1101" /LENGTH=320 /DNA_ID=CAMNT_0042645421 /DNA_START=184 /DNA_END=1146 /DNA_ORIENTATION=-
MNLSLLSSLGLPVLLVSSLETIGVSAWVPALRNNFPRTQIVSNPRHILTTLSSAIEETTETLTVDSLTAEQAQRILVQMPKIQYTVPGMKLGWKENGVWMDEDGPRNGPPQNYWRQNSDERLHQNNIALIKELLKEFCLEAPSEQEVDILQSESVSETIDRLERSNSMRLPSLNRAVLGDWAPIVRGGKIVSSSTDEEDSVEIPYQLRIQRKEGRKLAPKTNYGTFDEHLQAGEIISVEELTSSNTVTSTGTFVATSENSANQLVEGYNNPMHGDLHVGGVTYVTKYIMMMRKEVEQQKEDENNVTKGPITEIWMRIDPP